LNKVSIIALFILLILLSACVSGSSSIKIPEYEWRFTGTMEEQIPVVSFEAPQSTVIGNTDNFINRCKPVAINPLFFKKSKIKTHQIIFGFDAIYPVSRIELTNYNGNKADSIKQISIETSLNGITYKRYISDYPLNENTNPIDFKNRSARFIKMIFKAERNETYAIQDVRFFLGEGLIVEEDKAWTDAFLRYEHWTGADGIFSFNLDGNDNIGVDKDKTGFIFSDTFTGSVNPFNGLRNSNFIINNSVGYYDGSHNIKEGLTFDYRLSEKGQPQSAFLPKSYLGYGADNLLDNDGLTVYLDKDGLLTNEANGIMWRSVLKKDNYLIFDLYEVVSLGKLYIWNYNENPYYGVKNFVLSYSIDGDVWINLNEEYMAMASGSIDEPYTKEVNLQFEARYLKMNITETYDSSKVGLGKIHITDDSGQPLFATIEASDYDETITGNELSARLWLQDGVVIGNYLYVFPILIKDEGSIFKVTRVGLIKVPIKDMRFDFENAVYLNTPLQSRTADGGLLYYGAGVMNHAAQDGYLYIYGYKDLQGRFLIVARVKMEDLENFNRWTYFDGVAWSNNINDSYPIINKVSPELSVTYMKKGIFSGKYMLVVMEDSTSGRVSSALSDTPYGPFTDYTLLYETSEPAYLRGAFTYNAKMHPHLSEEGSYLISYNVNSLILIALQNVDIYRPRFIRVIEVKKRGE